VEAVVALLLVAQEVLVAVEMEPLLMLVLVGLERQIQAAARAAHEMMMVALVALALSSFAIQTHLLPQHLQRVHQVSQ
jgi:hypothetical protein